MKPLKHQKQPDNKTCTSTCLAMILDKPVEEVIEEFHQKYMDYKMLPSDYLRSKGVNFKKYLSEDNSIQGNHLYLITVPSLNITAGIHHILLDARYYPEEPVKVYDPQEGTGNKFYVYKESDNPDSHPLGGYLVDLEILNV